MALDTSDSHLEAQYKKDAYELAKTLRPATCVKQVHAVQVTVHGADVLLELNQRTIPKAMLDTIGDYGDLRIEGTNGPTLEATVQL
jgi:hypothetical protein